MFGGVAVAVRVKEIFDTKDNSTVMHTTKQGVGQNEFFVSS